MKKIIASCISIVGLFVFALPAFAHVVVYPNQVGVAAFQEFTVSVPAEKDNPTVAVKLLIPNGLSSVTPNVKAGWTINIKRNGAGDDAKVTEIDWTGGSIPPDQRDDFLFQAQVPAKETTLNWKAYQTYQDGSVIAWEHDPKLSRGPDDDSAPPPYSTTKVINDLTGPASTPAQSTTNGELGNKVKTFTLISEVALALSLIALGMARMNKK